MRPILLAPLLLLGCATVGDSPDRLMAAWMRCLADAAPRFAASSEAADVAADAALGACSAEEGAVAAAERRGVTGAGRERLAAAQRDGRAVMRQRVIARIVEIRAVRR